VQKAEYEIADCFYQLGNEKEAMVRFKALRSKYPDSKLTVEIIWWLGEYYYRHNELSLARRYFSSLIQDFSKSNLVADAYYALGSIDAEESAYPEAIGNFQKVIASGKSDLTAQAAVAIGDIYLRQGQIDSALKTYKDAVRDYPNFAQLIHPKIADIYNKTGNYDEAKDYYRKSLEIVPVKEMSSIQFKIAEVLQAQGKFPEAIEEYLKVTYLYSEDNDLTVKALLRVAGIYEDKENFNEAMNIYRKIAAMNVGEAKYAQERMDWIKAHVK
jgi:TolA-binding protein